MFKSTNLANKMKKTLYLLTFLILIPFFVSAHGGHADPIIHITSAGFEPNELTVFEGDVVLFINNDEAPRQPVSDTTEVYPGFGDPEAIKPNDSWKFTFTDIGTWRIKDNLNTNAKGIIVVLKDPNKSIESQVVPSGSQDISSPSLFSKIKSLLGSFFHKIGSFFKVSPKTADSVSMAKEVDAKRLKEFKSQDENAKYTWLEDEAKREDPKIAWEYVKAAYNTPQGVVGNPHDLAHLVGQLIFKQYGLDGLSICDASFAFGCYHGLMERAFFGNKPEDYKNNLLKAADACKGVGAVDSPNYWSCIHGMGHGIATFREYKLDPALTDCNILPDGIQTYCQDGVFMEFSVNAPRSFYKPEDPVYPCDAVDQKFKIACARSQVQVMRLRFSMNTEQIAEACTATGNADIVFHCIDALGYFIGQNAPNSSNSAEAILSGCGEIKDKAAAAQCSAAAAGELVFQNSANWKDTVQKVCSSFEGDFESQCNARIDNVKKSYGRN